MQSSFFILFLVMLTSTVRAQIRDALGNLVNNIEEDVSNIFNIDNIRNSLQDAGLNSLLRLFDLDIANILDDLQNANLSNQSSIQQTITIMDIFNEVNLTEPCDDCKDFIQDFRKVGDSNLVQDALKRGVERFCQTRFDSNLCSASVSTYSEIIIDSMLFEEATPEQVCQAFALCPYTTENGTLVPYVQEVTQNKPAPNVPTPTNRSTYRILQITDIHIDFLYEIGTNAFCGTVQCCRTESGPPLTSAGTAGYWGTLGTCDIPYRTFEQFVQFATSNLNISKILWTGDNINHDVFNQAQRTQTYPTYNITENLLQYFPQMSVAPMFGNHENFPSDQYDTVGTDSDWLTQELGEMWDPWLEDQSLSSFIQNSYYSEIDTERNLKIITLDTQTCDTLNFYLIRDTSQDPLGQLAWLQSELASAEQNNQSVWIMGHIPPGNLNCDPQWSERYRALVDRYSNIIRAQFFGHTHNDQIQLVRSFENDSPVGVYYIAPSLTTYVGLNPSFRVFEIDAETNLPVNYYQYRLDLAKWNQNTTGPIEWDIAYNFLEEYNLPDMSLASIDSLVDQIRSNETVARTYASNFVSGNLPEGPLSQRETDYLYCNAKYGTPEAVVKCLNLDPEKTNLMYFATLYVPSFVDDGTSGS